MISEMISMKLSNYRSSTGSLASGGSSILVEVLLTDTNRTGEFVALKSGKD